MLPLVGRWAPRREEQARLLRERQRVAEDRARAERQRRLQEQAEQARASVVESPRRDAAGEEEGISFSDIMRNYTTLLAQPPAARAQSAAATRLQKSGLLAELRLRAPLDGLLSYAEYLGMDVERDWQLLWIADEALHTPAPPGWEQHQDVVGDIYYYNVVTADTSPQHPNDYHYQQLYYRERVQLLKQLAPEALTAEDLTALEELTTFRAVVLYNFDKEEHGEMTVRGGDKVTVLAGEVAPEGWYMAAFMDEVGLVPMAYVEETVTVYQAQDPASVVDGTHPNAPTPGPAPKGAPRDEGGDKAPGGRGSGSASASSGTVASVDGIDARIPSSSSEKTGGEARRHRDGHAADAGRDPPQRPTEKGGGKSCCVVA